MTNSSSDSNKLSELEIISRILSRLPQNSSVRVPPGDDSAVVTIGEKDTELVLTSDPVIEGTHFEKGTDPSAIGHKAAGRVLSDLAAMGAVPRWVLLNIAAPANSKAADFINISDSASRLCSEFGAVIIGGDVAQAPVLSVNAFAIGTAPKGTSITRGGARPGDAILVSGRLGDSIRGKHLSFTPRIKEGIWLRENKYPTAMIDITDGLATDLRHILKASSVGAVIKPAAIPAADTLKHLSAAERFQRAVTDGEDFELLFTVPPARCKELLERWHREFSTELCETGYITEDCGKLLTESESGEHTEMTAKGFEHFEKDNS